MPVMLSDVQIYYTGGRTNSDRDASLGGERSDVLLPFGSPELELNNMFPDVYGVEAQLGSVRHRCFYVLNTAPAGEKMYRHQLRISVQPTRTGEGVPESYQIGLDPVGLGDGINTGVPQQISRDTDNPIGVSFMSAPPSNPLLLETIYGVSDVDGGQGYALWVRRIVPPGCTSKRESAVTLMLIWDMLA